MAIEGLSATIGERNERRGSVTLVLLVAAALVVAAIGLIIVERGQTYVVALLAILGVIGVFSLFALAAGVLRISVRGSGHGIADNVLEHALDGIAVTDGLGRVLYANAAYRTFADARGAEDVRPIERVFVGDPDISEAVYRLLKAAQEGRPLQEEVRLAGGRSQPARWLRLRVRPFDAAADPKADTKTSVWTVADVTRDRERQENVFQELQQAIDYLDHAPAGFFSVDALGAIAYMNATLASWLDHDLAQIGIGGLRLTDVVAGDASPLITHLTGAPCDVATDILDLDLKARGGKPVPVRLFHKVAFGADGVAGPSRTLVLNRARDAGDEPARAAEVRFMRFFQN